MVSDSVVEEVRERADLVELFREHSSLRRSGRTWRGPCPLHGGEGPNFSVDPTRAIFKCFVCGEGGDVFAFFMKVLGLDFPEAVRYVAERVGVSIPDDGDPQVDPHAHLREVLAFAHEWYAERLASESDGGGARSYLASRGLDMEAAREFGIGYAPAGWRALREAALTRGISEADMLEVGLLATSERAEEPYDRFRDRLTFTIFDLRDRPIGFGGRSLGPPDPNVPKYINSPESSLFRKGSVLYGLNRARHSIRREGHALLAEGFLDVVTLSAAGFTGAVAPLGTALTPDQAALLGRYGKQVYLLYDSDQAGLKATFRAADCLLAAGVHPLVVTLPAGEDPDSLLRSGGAQALNSLLPDAVDVLERKLQILQRQGYLDSIEGRRRSLDGLLSTLRAVRDPALLDIYMGRAAEGTGIRRETLVHEVARGRPSTRPETDRAGTSQSPRRPGQNDLEAETRVFGVSSSERAVLLLLMRDPGLEAMAAELGLTAEYFRDPVLRMLAEGLLALGCDAGQEGVQQWADGLSPELATAAEVLRADATEFVHSVEMFEQSARRLLVRDQLERLDEIDRELVLAEEAQARNLLREKEAMARTLREAGVTLSFLRRMSRSHPVKM